MIRLGILGAGQLSLMLAEEACKLSISVSIFSDSPTSPALRASPQRVIAPFDEKNLREFFKTVDCVVFESEFIDVPLLRKASEGLPVSFLPDLSVMEIFQDKLSQKHFCLSQNVPTSRFTVLDTTDVGRWFESTLAEFGGNLVLKWSRLGYDGKGNLFVKDGAYVFDDVLQFITAGQKRGGQIYAEELISFEHELAIVCCRTQQGKIMSYPVVISEQRSGICLNVKGPATSFGISEDICKSVAAYAETIGTKGGIVGTFAVELFLRGSELFVNEIAPRVHNTGHYTQDACIVSQFENHLRAALNWELGIPEAWPFFAMRNILGPEKVFTKYIEPPSPSETSALHWYGKEEIKPFRKLGHINTVAMTEAVLSAKFLDVLQDEEVWISRVRDCVA